jgi:Toprim domain
MHLDGCLFNEACETLTGEPRPGGNGARAPDPQRERREHEQRARIERDRAQREAAAREYERLQLQHAEQAWREASPTLAPPALDYLARRGIVLDDVPEGAGLRWHPRCRWETGTAPCIVARYTDVLTGEPRGIWRRPITGEKPKTLGLMGGCVIRLWPDDWIAEGLVIGEGVETTLAAATRIEHRGTLLRPAWAAGCAGNLEDFPILPGIEVLTILVDHDASGTGQKAAQACAQRWFAAGREVIRLMPGNPGADFNDVVKS